MSSTPPPDTILAAILSPTTRITRRVEIYEADGATLWNPDVPVGLVDGTISVDYSRDERRSLDLTLDNSDNQLMNAPGYFWYDKIIKVFRGATVNTYPRPPHVIIVGGSTEDAQAFRSALATVGFDDVRINLLASTMLDLVGYEVIVSLGNTDAMPRAALMAEAYDAGYAVFTQGADTPIDSLPFVTGMSDETDFDEWDIAPNLEIPSELTTGWLAEAYPAATGYLPYEVDETAQGISEVTQDDTDGFSILAAQNANGLGGKWIHFAPPLGDLSVNFQAFLRVGFTWLNPYITVESWETQIGEFMIDKISEDNFPHQTKITGRDYTKKCLNSCFETAIEFDGPNNLEDLIADISANAGITKKVLPTTGVVVNQTFSYDRGTPRWQAMKEIANAYSYDVYFDGQGYLRLEYQTDPATTAPTYTFQTGAFGNMATYTKSTDDSRLYNHVIVTGGTGDDTTSLPPSAEARNDDPNSPTSIPNIGDRLYQYASDFITTDDQAQQVADTFLAVHALEEFELDFDAIVLAWLDVGEIIQWVDPRPSPGDPDMFLLQTLSIPVALGPMSAMANRVTVLS